MKIIPKILLISVLLSFIPSIYAHHAFNGEFDVNSPVELRGEVVNIRWINPHRPMARM